MQQRALRAWAAVLAATVGLSATNEATADQCLRPESKRTCPQVERKASGGKAPKLNLPTATTKVGSKPRTDDLKPVNPTEITKAAERDTRRQVLEPKARKLLITEINNVERLLGATPRDDKDRPRLMLRLAENYVELEASAFRDKVIAEEAAMRARKKAPQQAAKHKKEAAKAIKVVKVARKNAIKYYSALADQYPRWCRDPGAAEGNRGCIDEVLYYLAYEHEQAGDLDEARKVYLELTEKWKTSKYVPSAYLAFGELFFQDAQGDPSKWEIAGNFYKKVLEYPAPDNRLWGYAAYKLGYVHWNLGDHGKAIDAFKQVIDFGQRYASLPNAAGLAKAARRDIIPVYALKGDPKKAYAFFKPLSGESNGDDATFAMMSDLGQNLLDTGHYAEAIVLYEDLIKRDRNGSESCAHRAKISEAVMATKGGDKKPIVAALEQQLSTYQRFAAAGHDDKAKLTCANLTASLLTETAMAWHLEAVGSGGVRGTGDQATMDQAERLYDLVLDNFTKEQFDAFRFPHIVKQDWPTTSKVAFAHANLLFSQKRWERCGPAFDRVVADDPKGDVAAEAAYAAVLCYRNAFHQDHDGKSHLQGRQDLDTAGDAARFAPKELTPKQKAMVDAFDRYVCLIEPPKADDDAFEEHCDVQYARARTYYEAQHWEEAARAFREVAHSCKQKDVAVYAAHLYLESLNILGTKLSETRDSCVKTMREDLPVFIESFCSSERLARDPEEYGDKCVQFEIVLSDVTRLEAEALVKRADAGGPDSLALYERAAELYLSLWEGGGRQACIDKTAACAKQEEILYNAAQAFQSARLIAKAISVRKILINPDYGLQDTVPAQKAVYEIGGNYQAIAVYDLAATWYERFAERSPKLAWTKQDGSEVSAANALSDAVVLRLGLGQRDEAIADAKLFQQRYGRSAPEKAAQIAFAIGHHYAEREDWQRADEVLNRQAMLQIDKHATIDLQLQAHALLGRVNQELGRAAQADKHYALVRDSWRDPAARKQEIMALAGSEATNVRRLGKSLTAVGEAMYHFADQKRRQAEALKFPVYRGSGERADVERFIATKVKDWVQAKQPAIVAAEKEFVAIAQLEPEPPPKWVVKAGATVGRMWGNFVAEFRAAPYPSDWDKPGPSPYGDPNDPSAPPLLWHEIRAMYWDGLDKASEPQKQAAKRAYVACLNTSRDYQYFDSDSRACEEWLSKTYPSEYHLIDEFRGAPTRVSSGLDERAPALQIGGAPYVEARVPESADRKVSAPAAN